MRKWLAINSLKRHEKSFVAGALVNLIIGERFQGKVQSLGKASIWVYAIDVQSEMTFNLAS